MLDTVLCSNKEEAKKVVDDIGCQFLEDWEFLDGGEVKLYLKEGWKNESINRNCDRTCNNLCRIGGLH